MPPILSLPNALSDAECANLITLVQASKMKPAGLVRGTAAPHIRRADIAWLDDIPAATWVLDRMIGLVAAANRDGFRYDIAEFGESPQVACYDAEQGAHFDWHQDIGAGQWAAQRKLTIVVQLSDPVMYDGGTLEMRPDSNITTAVLVRGTATVFPSYVLHRVAPVTRGTRWSLTLWAHGPAFR